MELKHGDMIAKLTLFEKASLLKGKNVWETRGIDRIKLPSAFLADGPHGLRKQAGSADILGLNPSLPATCFPTASGLANSWDEELLEEVGAALGEEAAALDVSVLLGPGLNIKRSPLCGRSFEYFSEDPLLSGKMAAALIRGIQSKGVSACPKHFAANSQELLRMSSNSVLDERTLREIYLTGFEIAVREGRPKSIMSSYNRINGQYAHENYHLLTEILRGEWGFEGAVISDWGGVNDTVQSVKNGGTLEMPGGGLDSARQIVKAVESGVLSEDTLNKRVDELIGLVLSTADKAQAKVDFDKHHALARKAAGRGIVLLKNEGGLLPLKKGLKAALIGEFARTPRFQGAGSSQVNAYKVDTALGLAGVSGLTLSGFSAGYRFDGRRDGKMVKDAVRLAEMSDVVVFFPGLDNSAESEGLDRRSLNLPQNQLDLLDEIAKTGRPIAAVLTAGSVVDMSWTAQVQAVVHGFLHGQAGAGAILDVLTGKVNPSGKLAETYPLKLEDTPCYGNYPAETPSAQYREGLFVGYRHYETADSAAAFPFGFGLSYTSFEYSGLRADKNGAAFTITNTGGFDGAEIAQLYIRKIDGALVRPVRELKGFKRVQLQAGESAAVSIPFDDKTFRYFSVETGAWEIEGGEYEALIGASVKDIRLSAKLFIQGTYGEKSPVKKIVWKEDNGHWLEGGGFGPNNALRQAAHCKSLILRLGSRIIAGKIKKSDGGKPDLNMVLVYNMPFRAYARNAGHIFTMEMVDGVVEIANGHFFKGLGRVISGFFHNKKLNKQGERELNGGGRK
jgi:beta-glucosidase